jgi:alkaline phosphatase D
MKKFSYLLALFILSINLQAQTNYATRLLPDAYLAPFYHGVASGDPLPDRVILWTRITNGNPNPSVNWRIATDTGMVNIVQQGNASTDASKDFTIKIDAAGLLAATTYYYEFEHEGVTSLRGRTKTLPVGDTDSLRFAVVSCSNMGHGFFNAYNRIVARNDIDAVLHLGDYEYEYGNGEFGSVRTLTPLNEVFTLNDYRMRHADYKLDADLRSIQQQYAFISVWDDHETANDAWKDGAGNHTESTEGLFINRRAYSTQAYFEWMPVRPPNAAAPQQIYRKFDFGDLAQLNMVDTRLEARDQQTAIGAAINTNASRTLMGAVQFDWLCNNLRNSTRKWQILGNQVMMAPIKLFGQVLNPDQWDGYPAERARLYDTIMTHNIQNFVVLTGDIHTAWANDLPLAGYTASTGANSAGVEFVCTSVTSTGLPFNVPQGILQSSNPHNKYLNLTEHGYTILDINKQRTQGEWYYVNTVTSPSTQETFAAARYNTAGTRFLQSTTTPSIAHPTKFTTPAPPNPRFTNFSTLKPENGFLDLYPNPLQGSEITVRYYLPNAQTVLYAITDVSGKLVFTKSTIQQAGLVYDKLILPTFPLGIYIMTVKTANATVSRKVIIN